VQPHPSWKQDAAHRALRGTWRNYDNQIFDLAICHSLKVLGHRLDVPTLWFGYEWSSRQNDMPRQWHERLEALARGLGLFGSPGFVARHPAPLGHQQRRGAGVNVEGGHTA
jgi:hypothetical protein